MGCVFPSNAHMVAYNSGISRGAVDASNALALQSNAKVTIGPQRLVTAVRRGEPARRFVI